MSEGSVSKRRVARPGKRTKALAVLTTAVLATGLTYGTAMADDDSDSIKARDSRFVIPAAMPFAGSVHTLFNFAADKKHGKVDGFANFEQQAFGAAVINRLQGKITCLDVQGKKAGFLFTVERGSAIVAAPAVALFGQVVRVSVEDNGYGSADKITVGLPMPAAMAGTDCSPQAATNSLTEGNIKFGKGTDFESEREDVDVDVYDDELDEPLEPNGN